MSKLSSHLLEEMQSIFGGDFGASMAGLLAEDAELGEARGGSAKASAQQAKGQASGRKGRAKGAGKKPLDAKSIERMARRTSREGGGSDRESAGKAELDKFRKGKSKFTKTAAKARGGGEAGYQKAYEKFKSVRKKSEKASAGGSSAAGGGGGGAQAKSGGGGKHYPFKRRKTIGLGPGTPPGFSGTGPRRNTETKCWNCSCPEGTYASKGCKCTSSGSGKNCPKAGTVKRIKIKQNYHQAYNRQYHPWRAKQGR